MALASATANRYVSFSGRKFPFSPSPDSSPSLSFTRNPSRSLSLPLKIKSFPLAGYPIRLLRFSFAAVAGDTTATQNDITHDKVKLSGSSEFSASLDTPVYDGVKKEEQDSDKSLDDDKMIRVCDKLIEVFMVDKPTPTDWRRLLAFSKEWSNIRPHFFKRCQDRAGNEDDPEMKHKLHRLARKLKEIDEDVERHNELLNVIKEAQSDVSKVVAKRRKDFTKEFFVHLHTVAQSYYNDPAEQDAVAKLGNMCLAAVQAYDAATDSMEALNAAELKFQDIINSPTVDAACRKIDSLAEKNQLDSALVLMITKAWSAAKESNMTKDEVKDVLYHLYVTARDNLQRLMPKEIRILKYLLTIEDPEELLSVLKDAFTPGEEIEGKDVDSLYTTPEKLHTWIRTVVDTYHFSREGTLIREARDLMNPKLIKKMEELMRLMEKDFM